MTTPRAHHPIIAFLGIVLTACLALAPAALGQSAQEHVDRLELRWWAEDAAGGVFDIARTADGLLWAATGDGLLRLDGTQTTRFLAGIEAATSPGLPRPPSSESFQPVRAVEPDGTGALVVALDDGAYRFDGRRFLLLSRPGVGGRPWSARLLKLDQDRVLWVAASDTLLRLLPDAYSLRQGLPGVAVSLLWEDPFGYLWATTESGHVFRRLGNAFQPVNFPLGMGDRPVLCLHLGSNGLLWLLRSDDAWKVDGDFAGAGLPRQAEPFALMSDLDLRTCTSEPGGALWLGTERGLSYLAADGSRAEVPGLDSAVRSILVSEDGSVWAGTEQGLAQLRDPSLAAPLPSVLVTAAAMDDEEIAPGGRYDLASSVGTLRLTLSAPSFRHPGEVRVRFRRGDDEPWMELGGTDLVLDDLPTGESEVTLQAGLGEQWNQPGTKIEIHCEPAVWQTRPFWGAIGAGLGAIAIWFFYLRWAGPGPSPLDYPGEIDDDIVHLEDLDTDELKVSRETVERARKNIFGDQVFGDQIFGDHPSQNESEDET